jgi:MFS family permease
MIAGILATSAGLILAGSISTPLGLYLSYGVLVGAGSAGCGMVVTSVSIGKWFHRYRGLAIGISSMGIGVGTMLMAPFAGYLVKHYGWRNGFLFIGILMLAVGISISYVFMGKSGPAQMGLMPDGEKPAHDENHSATPAKVEEKASLKPILITIQFWIMVLYAYALVYGFGYGSLAPVMPYMIADRFGRQALGAAYGLGIFFATGLGGSVGPILGGYIYDKTGSYDLGWLICIVVLLIAAVTILMLKPSQRPPAERVVSIRS